MRKQAFLVIFLIASAIRMFGQKLPNKQLNSVWAPDNIKIDGKADEWGNKFQAYNDAASVFYTIANDHKNLYVIIQATDPVIIRHLINWGIKFSIDLSEKKIDKGAFSVTYPYFEKKEELNVNLNARPKIIAGSDSAVKQLNDFKNDVNKTMTEKMKLIKVLNAKLSDTVISIYNEDGIKATAHLDNQLNYVYELSVPLKVLGIAAANPIKFAYHIVVNGNPKFYPGVYAKIDKITRQVTYQVNPPGLTGTLPTDFWGEYTLAKKP